MAWARDPAARIRRLTRTMVAGAASRRRAAAFGVEMTTWRGEDPANADPRSSAPGRLVFRAENGLLGDHPIVRGRSAEERVSRVLTFAGQALRPGPRIRAAAAVAHGA